MFDADLGADGGGEKVYDRATDWCCSRWSALAGERCQYADGGGAAAAAADLGAAAGSGTVAVAETKADARKMDDENQKCPGPGKMHEESSQEKTGDGSDLACSLLEKRKDSRAPTPVVPRKNDCHNPADQQAMAVAEEAILNRPTPSTTGMGDETYGWTPDLLVRAVNALSRLSKTGDLNVLAGHTLTPSFGPRARPGLSGGSLPDR